MVGKLSCYKIIKKFLNQNQIFFTTIASVLLGVMAIIVSVQTNNIAERQLQIDKFEHLPNFSIEHEYLGITDTAQLIRNHELKLYNNYGGKYKNLEVKIVGSFDVNIQDNEGLRTDLKLNGKFITVFLGSSYTIHNKGIVKVPDNLVKHINAIIKMDEYFNLGSKIRKDLIDRYRLDYWGPFENYIYAELKYLDFMNEQKYEYYDIYANGESTLLAVSNKKLEYVQLPDRQIYLDLRTLDTNNMDKVVDRILDMSVEK